MALHLAAPAATVLRHALPSAGLRCPFESHGQTADSQDNSGERAEAMAKSLWGSCFGFRVCRSLMDRRPKLRSGLPNPPHRIQPLQMPRDARGERSYPGNVAGIL